MKAKLLNITLSSKQELDEVIHQYENGGKALHFLWEYETILRDAYKHGHEPYLDDIKKIITEGPLDAEQKSTHIGDNVVAIVASACLEYFRTKYYETKNENGVEES
jgi:hypothetical protein